MADRPDDIYDALARAQGEFPHAAKDKKNPHFNAKYATLTSVIDAVGPALRAEGFAIVQTVEGATLRTALHRRGESLSHSLELLVTQANMQALGSAITYARRYGLLTLAGLAVDDDDGTAAKEAAKNKAKTIIDRKLVQTLLEKIEATNLSDDLDKAEKYVADKIISEADKAQLFMSITDRRHDLAVKQEETDDE